MARSPDILYINTYVPGSAAPKLEPRVKPKQPVAVPQPQARPKTRTPARKVIRIDPISLCATVVAGAMLVAMAVGMLQLGAVRTEAQWLEEHVAQLQVDNTRLHAEYKAGYDLDEVRQQALEMGLVPQSQVEHVTIHAQAPQAEQEPGFWESFWASIKEMFA